MWRNLEKDLAKIEVLCDEILELETTKRVKKIRDNVTKIKEIIANIEKKCNSQSF